MLCFIFYNLYAVNLKTKYIYYIIIYIEMKFYVLINQLLIIALQGAELQTQAPMRLEILLQQRVDQRVG